MSSKAQLYIGLDVGSTTVKSVVVDAAHEILWKTYCRHNAKQPEAVRAQLAEIESVFPGKSFKVFTTGNGGRSLAPLLGGAHHQEVNAVTFAVEQLYPSARSVVELGGQDAKVIIWKEDGLGRTTTLSFMNDKCAGGTGATIDKIFGKLGLSMQAAASIRAHGKTVHHIAAKCGVFAETDVVGLLKAGVPEDEIVVSLAAAIIKQNVEVLLHGNALRDDVLLLGGPHAFLPVFADLWREQIPETWRAHGFTPDSRPITELVVVPADAEYYAALGAVLLGLENEALSGAANHPQQHAYTGTAALDAYIKAGRTAQLEALGNLRPGLVDSEAELEAFRTIYAMPEFCPPSFAHGARVRAFLGVDGGSTSTKLALLDESGTLIYKDYVLSQGNPIEDVRVMLARLGDYAATVGMELELLATGVTGYAAKILSHAFCFDVAVVETVAHMKSATHYYGEIDVICDVGGQDIKVLMLRHGRVVDIKLNTQCSAGNGFFLQNMAEQFGIPVEEYADHAFSVRRAPSFNYGCAVFMEQDKVNFQQLGWTKDEIMAGLALVLPLNIWNYVVQETNLARLGTRFLLQGGTQRNLAAVKAEVDYIKVKIPSAEVFVHKHADVSGAIGAALEALHGGVTVPSRFVGIDRAVAVSFESTSDEGTRCTFCSNRCPRSFIDIRVPEHAPVRFITGYGCDQGSVETVFDIRALARARASSRDRCPNLVERAAHAVFEDYPFEPIPTHGTIIPGPRRRIGRLSLGGTKQTVACTSGALAAEQRKRVVVGLPRLLNMFYYGPFFSTYFRCLGLGGVVWSDFTSPRLWAEGNMWGAIDPCFPAKVAPAHVFNLLQNPRVTHVCFPMITRLESMLQDTMGGNACVIQMGTPEVVHAALSKDRDLYAERGVEYWKPLLRLDRPAEAKGQLFEYFAERLGVTAYESDWAAEQGYAAMESYLERMQQDGRAVLERLVANDEIGLLLIGHPYHHDPGLNHGILERFQLSGFPVLCIEALPTDQDFLGPLFAADEPPSTSALQIHDLWPRCFNRNTNAKLWAAKVAAKHPNLAVIDLSSFKCGHDAPTYGHIDAILDAAETPHFLFHDLDQNKPSATFEIRIQSIDYFLKLEQRRLVAKCRGWGGARTL